MTRDGSGNLKFYVDGQLRATGTDTNPFISVATTLGGFENGLSSLNAQLDEVRVWNVERTIGEIQANLYSTLSGSETELVAYYRFDETTGTLLPDLAGNNDGTLINMAGTEWTASGAMTPKTYQATDASINGFTANWQAIANAQTVTIDIATDQAFTTTVATGIAASTPTGSSFFVAQDLSTYTGQKLYYRLRFTDGSFVSPYSEPVAFMVTPGNALAFDGVDDHINVPANTDFDFTAGTIEAWVKPSANSDNKVIAAVRSSAAQTRWSLHINEGLDHFLV
ncbi:MAG: LamG-like jellyroll fold domain-containing protein, partial [Cyclobacteriaceae bacterium]